ncbi:MULTISPECIES: HopJ type III effector protein [unclassified Streptomyces]|uniref:HopJ type III effector protein n=1 Tax=unclassified Streptomyces TaxID=2593676 RepID=UPI002E314D0C|nr:MULTISPECIES: HopJ type III effector protein [unclassified Streptomyces]WUC68370.1 HopJ type III effector protein [Streptomyces sp. NBC_00539]
MTDLNTLRASLASGEHEIADTLAFVAAHYEYQPQAFCNGELENATGENEGYCKTLGLALLEGLSDPGLAPTAPFTASATPTRTWRPSAPAGSDTSTN